MVLGARDSGEPWLAGSGLGPRAAAVRQLRLEHGAGQAAHLRVTGSLHVAFPPGLSSSSLQQACLRAVVALFTSPLGASGVGVHQARWKMMLFSGSEVIEVNPAILCW